MTKQSSSERAILNDFNSGMDSDGSGIGISGVWKITITRADGSLEESTLKNIVVHKGLDTLARHVVDLSGATGESPFNYLAIGTVSTAPTISNTQVTGEVANGRKIGATLASSREVALIVATWAGFADTLTSLSLEEAGWFDHANSGQGNMLNRVTGVNAILADSDFLKLQVEVQIGSHNITP